MFNSNGPKVNIKTLNEVFTKNKNTFSSAILDEERQKVQISRALWRYLYTLNSHSFINKLMAANKIPHPKERKYPQMTKNDYNNLFADSNTSFSLSRVQVKDPKMKHIKRKGNHKEMVFFDFNGTFFSSLSPFKKFQKFTHLRYLSLHDCGLTLIPPELANPPKNIVSLDLSFNYISQLPDEVHWSNLQGLNLSNNAFTQWPKLLDGSLFPQLEYLSISFNNLSSTLPQQLQVFPNLITLDLSYTNVTILPDWIFNLNKLNTLSLRGNSLVEGFSFKFLCGLSELRILDISNVPLSKNYDQTFPKSLELLIDRNADPKTAPKGSFVVVY
ncbi:leucine-rich repeat domain-containing protein [Histomonas meleagridis]|uniref:leucine-rich repeat domain-containing protein n=1 Tax=Histomonas meleagridis TaxID=135588 RepID=UPI00355A0070|nr:leucine-rich repeat domain-containing protein [Histomonas meleagridis]KAH0797299.1 leucine-rich repeat domain-containing protein [Histomonas meleagridis]